MGYKIERKSRGVIKRFSGVVTYEDVLRSEQDVHSDPDFTTLRYVISDYVGAEYSGLTASQKDDINALRIGGHLLNPHVKYAFAIKCPNIRSRIASAVANGDILHPVATFESVEDASDWAGLSATDQRFSVFASNHPFFICQ